MLKEELKGFHEVLLNHLHKSHEMYKEKPKSCWQVLLQAASEQQKQHLVLAKMKIRPFNSDYM